MILPTILPKQAAKSTPKTRDYLSFSAMNLYRSCPLRYKFYYLDGLPEEAVSASLVFGSAVHRSVELHFIRLLAGEPLPSIDEMLAVYHDTWRDQLAVTQVKFNKDDDIASLAKLAGRMLEAFWNSPVAQPVGHVIGVEEELRGSIIPGVPDLLGRIDLLIDTDDAVIITDFKTSRSRWSRDQAEDSAEQLLLYSELVKKLVPGKQMRLQFVVLTKTKQPVVDVHELPVMPQQVVRIKRIVERVWKAIEAGSFYPTPSPLQCPSCPYREPCRAWKG
jgi:putative RecB family exonuclease